MPIYACPKPQKGLAVIARKDRQKAIKAFEEAEKRKVRLRDKQCRWPECAYCRSYNTRLEVAHLEDKKMGGDHGLRSHAANMILLCFLRHQGPISLHSGDCRITPLTEQGTNGPCLYEMQTEAGWKTVFCEEAR